MGMRLLLAGALLTGLATGSVALGARAQQPRAETGYSVYRQYCGGCHDNPMWNHMTLPRMRTIGEPRVRHSILDEGEEAIHPFGDKISRARIELLIKYLGPDADKSLDCGPPGSNLSPTPQCPDTGIPIGPPPSERRAP